MRRHITLNFREVVGVEDEVLDVHSDQVGQASSAGTLTGEGALLASLNAKRTGKMTDIVATIRSRPHHPRGSQSGPWWCRAARAQARPRWPCTGPPAVHAQTHWNGSGVLVIGPSSTFLHYIDQVLPRWARPVWSVAPSPTHRRVDLIPPRESSYGS